MKRNMHRKGALLFAVLLAAVFLGMWNMDVHQAYAGEHKEDVTVKVSCGFDNNVKYGRYMRVTAVLNNSGGNLAGELSLLIPQYDNDNIMYQKNAVLAAGETKRISFDIPYTGNDKIVVKLVDENGDIIVKKTENIAAAGISSDCLVGVLSDDFSSLSYLRGVNRRLIPFDAEQLPDTVQGLDSLDVLIVDNFDTGSLSVDQYDAVTGWVENGGTLVLGTGSAAAKTLSAFKEVYLTGRIGELGPDGVLDISLADAGVVTRDKERVYHQKEAKGRGNVQIISYMLSDQSRIDSIPGQAELGDTIAANLSDYKEAQLGKEQSQGMWYDDSIMRNIGSLADGKLPSAGKYAVILAVYILLAGPVLYLILKKKDKRNLMWVMVPALSVIFALGIYIFSSDTRINKPFAGYLSILTVTDDKSDVVLEETDFSITAPYNKNYQIVLDNQYQITPESRNGYYGYQQKESVSGYRRAVKYDADKVILEVRDTAAFTPVYFSSSGKRTLDIKYNYDLVNTDFSLKGTFSNQMDFDIRDAYIFSNNTLTEVGDLKAGSTVNVDNGTKYLASSGEQIYQNDILYSMTGGYRYDNMQDNQRMKYYALEKCLYQDFDKMSYTSYLLGFVEDDISGGLTDQLNMETSGLTVLLLPLSVSNYYNGRDMITDIYSYGRRTDNTAYSGNTGSRYMQFEEELYEYDFDGDTVTGLYYLSEWNNEFDSVDKTGFYGTVSAYNYDSGQYDVIFTSRQEGSMEGMEAYCGENRPLLLLYTADHARFENYGVTIPVIGVSKETEQ